MKKIQLAIVGFDQLGQALVEAVDQHEDLAIQSIFSRQSKEDLPQPLQSLPLQPMDQVNSYKDSIDVLIVCSGSIHDAPDNLTEYAANFNLVDAYNFYAKPDLLINTLDSMSQVHHKLAVIGVGWNPGLYSINQLLAEVVIPQATSYRFVENEWSQKMSDTLAKLEGVAEANVYLKASSENLNTVLQGLNPDLSFSDYHERVAYLVIDEGVDPRRIHDQVQALPNYLSQAETKLNFISFEQMAQLSQEVQAGRLIRSVANNDQITSYDLKLSFNQPSLNQAHLLLAYARAVYRLANEDRAGAFTFLDVPLSYLSPYDRKELLDHYL